MHNQQRGSYLKQSGLRVSQLIFKSLLKRTQTHTNMGTHGGGCCGVHRSPAAPVLPAESSQLRTSQASLPAKGSHLAQGDGPLPWLGEAAHTQSLVNAGGQV